VGLGAFGRHGDVGQRAGLVGQCQALGTLFGHQAGGLAQARRHHAALVGEIGLRLGIERLGIDHRVVEQAAGEPVAQRGAAAFVAVGLVFAQQRSQPFVEADGGLLWEPGRWPAHRRQHASQSAALHVVERVRLGAAGVDVAFLVARHALQDAEIEQGTADGDQFAPFADAVQGEGEAARGEYRLCRQLHQAFAEQVQGDLRFGAFQYRAGQGQQDVAAAVVVRQAARGVLQVGRTFVEPRAFAFDL